MTDQSRASLLSTIEDLLTTGAYSDLTVVCGATSYLVHLAIICPRFQILASLVQPYGTDSKTIDLSSESPDLIDRLVQFFYHADYEPSMLADPSGNEPNIIPVRCPASTSLTSQVTPTQAQESEAQRMSIDVRMFALGKKYEIEGLRELALARLRRVCALCRHTDGFEQIATLILRRNEQKMERLREVIVETVAAHWEMVERDWVKEMFRTVEGFELEVLRMKVAGSRDM